jgi:diguanylate cyclase (GGDEF)-like protein/PAS domain S-box-containing protein
MKEGSSSLVKAYTYASLGKYMDLLLDAVCVVDKEGRFLYVSAGCESIFGYTPSEMLGRFMIELVHPDDRELTLRRVDQIISGVAAPHFENRYIRKNGEVVHIMWSARWSEEDQCRIAVARDITTRKRAEALQSALYAISEATHSSENLPVLFERVHEVIHGLLPAINFSIALFDAARNELSFPYYVDQHSTAPELQGLDGNSPHAQVIRRKKTLLVNATPNAATQLESLSWIGSPLKSSNGIIGALVVQSYADSHPYNETHKELLQYVSTQVASAIERTQMLSRLQYMALYDSLTRLPNRGLFHDRIRLALLRANRNQEQCSLFYLDLDKFKSINDTYGHAIGDLLLEKVSRRLEQCVRGCDTVARLGGDEFVVLLENIEFPEQSERMAESIRSALHQPFDLVGNHITITPSLGIAHYPLHGDDEKKLLRYADDAMYREKNNKQTKPN